MRIRDVNDEPPTFNKREYYVDVPEDIPEGAPLPDLNMFVRDPDEVNIRKFRKVVFNLISFQGNNSAFSLSLIDISDVFAIEPEAAVGSTPVTIRVAKNDLDYEDPNQRKFIMLAVAREIYTEEKLSSTATIHVNVGIIFLINFCVVSILIISL